MRRVLLGVLLSCSFVSTAASAQDQQPPPAEPVEQQPQQPPEVLPPRQIEPPSPAPSEKPAEQKPLFRDEGLVLGLDFAFARGVGDAVDRLNAGSPTILPIGVSVSSRLSQKVMLGGHGHFGLASREDCSSNNGNNCTGRSWGLGAHVETALGTGPTVVPWFRYGIGWEMLYRGGYAGLNDAYAYRHALQLIDAKFGVDFVAHRSETGKTTRIGPFVGMITGVSVGDFGSYNNFGSRADLDRPNGDAHFWFMIGLRATTDP